MDDIRKMIDKIRSYKQQNIHPASLKKKILAVLEFYKKEFFDIPFIVRVTTILVGPPRLELGTSH